MAQMLKIGIIGEFHPDRLSHNATNQALKIVGVDDNGNARIVELSDHRFFMATLFLPQSSSSAEKPHPLVVEYLNAAKAFKAIKKKLN